MLKYIANLPRNIKIFLILFIDIISVIFSIEISFSVRLSEIYIPSYQVIPIFLSSIIIAIPVFYFFGIYSLVLRYMNLESLWIILKSTILYTLILGTFIYFSAIVGVPRSIIIINLIFITLCTVLTRALAHWIIYKANFENSNKDSVNIAILGVNNAAVELAVALKNESKIEVICFIDDTDKFSGQKINNIQVFKLVDLEVIIKNYNISKFLISKSSILTNKQDIIGPILQKYPITIQHIPTLIDLAQGDINIDDFKLINIEELLNREVIKPNSELLNKDIKDRVVMITGAGGSIGSEISLQAFKINPKKIILLDHGEYALYQILEKINKIKKDNDIYTEIVTILGSITQKNFIYKICQAHNVDTIYHAAAYKHVNMLENNVIEGLRNNILGTLYVAEAAKKSFVQNFVLISTDKAVRPTSVMGFSKRIAELAIRKVDLDVSQSHTKTKFTIVRFGNVIGSSGSAITLFSKQINSGGPVTVTDKNVIRYFMTIKEASELVIQAGGMNSYGGVYFLDMGQPIKILDLVKKMIHLSGKTIYDKSSGTGIKIDFIGLKKGEKLYEELTLGNEKNATIHPRIFSVNEDEASISKISEKLKILEEKIDNETSLNLITELSVLVPEFKIDK